MDSDDINFVALALQKSALLWTGDKILTTHLIAMGFNRVITTGELYETIL
ncbi:PIN domain-containing protein [Spirosoma areae]